MAKRAGIRVRRLSPDEKATIAATCERFIAETLKPRFLPVIRPTSFNYLVDIFGKWRGDRYSFITRYRSGFPDNAGDEFDSAFTRLDLAEISLQQNPIRRDVAPAYRPMVSAVRLRHARRGAASDGDRRIAVADDMKSRRHPRFDVAALRALADILASSPA